MIMKKKVQLGKAYGFLMKSYIIIIAVALFISVFGYAYSYWTIRQDINMNYSALLNEEKLTFDKVWNRVEANVSAVASNSIVKQLALSEKWEVPELYRVVDLISELKASLKDDKGIESIGAYFYKNKSFVTNNDRYAKPLNNLYLLKYGISVEQFLSGSRGVSGYFIIPKDSERYLVIYHNIFDKRYKEVIATAFEILPWSYLNESANSMFVSKNSGSYLINSKGILIGNTNNTVAIDTGKDSYLETDHVLYTKKIKGKEYIVSSATSDIYNIQYVIYAPKSVFFKNINFLKYIIIFEIVLFILAGKYLASYFSKKNSLPVEKLLTLLKIQKSEEEVSSFTQIYQNLENSLQSLITGHDNLYHRMNNIDLVVEKYVFTNLMHNWKPDNGWMEEYLDRIKVKYPLPEYRIILFSFNNRNSSIFVKEEEDGNHSIDFPLMIFAIENVINELIFYNEAAFHSSGKGVIIEMGDMTACIVNAAVNRDEAVLQEKVRTCIEFLRTAFKIDGYASISGSHKEYEELDLAYEEALMTITHKTFWGNSIGDVVLFDTEKAVYSDSGNDSKLFFQAKKMSNCLMMKDYEKASFTLDETIEKCFSKDIHKLSYNQFQAATLIFIILGNLSELGMNSEATLSSNGLMSYDRILSMGSLKEIKRNLHMILDEISVRYEETSKVSEEPEWLVKVEAYAKENFANPEINISAISNQFNISINHIGRTFKKYRGINMLDYIHQLRIKKCKELLEQGRSVTDCAQEVGYIDAKSLIRAYKRYEGITPGQYKSIK
ncbi:AraC family transcriptional regulator [Anaerocolumna sp. AGMB13025]|uniref:helix-turn-helix domain-containing protein n=1 Tax=Anaerocolumna sp. AGMB13025 TaxID=3039116 RepID=UPI00241F9148|nr:AraC family transcriptional regulator [Anaerocolumna sp. AGMB13025]WFR55734.1 AraC family transcriptional regulator [Anaerocolumna sp. AGMB13025]